MTDSVELATYHLLAGELDDALAVLSARLADAPHEPEARRLRAQIYTAQNTPESLRAALKDTDALAELTSEDYLRLALLCERLGEQARAVGTLASAVRVLPDDMRLRQRWMEAAFKAGDLTTARLAVQGMPDDWRLLEDAADLTAQYAAATGTDELFAQADVLYGAALDGLPAGEWSMPFRARILLARAGVNLRLNLPDEVARDAQAAYGLIPTEPACGFYIGWSLVKRGRRDDGLERVVRALKSAREPVRDALWGTIARDADFEEIGRAF